VRLVRPAEAAHKAALKLAGNWPGWVIDELEGRPPVEVTLRLSPGVSREAELSALGFDVWHPWVEAWAGLAVAGARVDMKVLSTTRRVPGVVRLTGLDAIVELAHLVGEVVGVDVDRGRGIARRLSDCGARLTPATLRAAVSLPDDEVGALMGALTWLRDHPDVSAWSARSLPVPGIHSKWLVANGNLLRDLTGRDVREEVLPRPAVAHVTYVDPHYLTSGLRRHDAWTTGDVHDLPYVPDVVVVVENRDCRLWFPPLPRTVVVEGGGAAAASLLADVAWIRRARTVVYWGDLDAAGFAILDRFRDALRQETGDRPARDVASVLMDAVTLDEFEHLGTTRDKDGRLITSSGAHLQHLTEDETAAYYAVATAGDAPVRRIEQERLPIELAAAAVAALAGL